MSAERVVDLFAACRAEGRAALLPYLTAGLPDPDHSVELFAAMADAGADGFEVGIPYSDPLMDGPVVQEAGSRALAGGTSMEGGLRIAGEVVAATGKPVLVMTYANPVLRVGPEAFAARAAAAGISGVIIADLPVDEAGPIQSAVEAVGLGMVLFAAPTTDEARLRQVVAADPLFVYGVAEMGVTGERDRSGGHVEGLVARLRALTTLPLVLGVGISTPEQAAAAGSLADGVIVGSALVRRVLEADSPAAAAGELRSAVSELAAALR